VKQAFLALHSTSQWRNAQHDAKSSSVHTCQITNILSQSLEYNILNNGAYFSKPKCHNYTHKL